MMEENVDDEIPCLIPAIDPATKLEPSEPLKIPVTIITGFLGKNNKL